MTNKIPIKSYFYVIHWNIQGCKSTFTNFIEKIAQKKQPILLSINEVNNDIVRIKKFDNVSHKAFDLYVRGYTKKSSQFFLNLNPTSIEYVGKKDKNGFFHRIVMSEIDINNKTLIIVTAHSPFGSGKNTVTSGSKIKVLFFKELLEIIKTEKPDIITMDANEPDEYANGVFNQMKFFDNRLNKSTVPEAYLFFRYLFKNYQLVRIQGPTYKKKNYDHIFYKKVNVKNSSEMFADAFDEHSSDHRPIVIKVEL